MLICTRDLNGEVENRLKTERNLENLRDKKKSKFHRLPLGKTARFATFVYLFIAKVLGMHWK